MTRIIAGEHRGRRLSVPVGDDTRPTSDRAREGLFSSLQSLLDLEGARVLDLYAGSGALALEALSRGAGAATLVERSARAVTTIRRNLEQLRLTADVVEGDVEVFLTRSPSAYDLIVLDPPYDVDVAPVLQALRPWMSPDAVVVVERSSREAGPRPPAGLRTDRSRRYGEATLWYFLAS